MKVWPDEVLEGPPVSPTLPAADGVLRASDGISSVTSGSAVVTRPIAIGGPNYVQISVLLAEFSNKVSGSLDSIVQVSNDGQNWSQLIAMSNDFSKAGTVQVATTPVSAKFLRVSSQANPAGNTVSFSLDVSLTSL